MKNRFLKALLISSVPALLALAVYMRGTLAPLENICYDWLRVRMSHRLIGPNRTDADVVLCVIDDHTLDAIQQFPITRNWYARFLDAIPESRLTGMDIFFIEPSPKTLSTDQRDAIALSAEAVAEGKIQPDEFKKRMDRYLVDPDREFRLAAERYGRLFLAMFLPPDEYDGMVSLRKERGARRALAERVQDVLNANNELFRAWWSSPGRVAGEIAAELEVDESSLRDDLTIDVVNNMLVSNDMAIVKQAYGQSNEMIQWFLEGRFDESLQRDMRLTQERIDHVRTLWYAEEAAPGIYKVYKDSLASGGSSSLHDTAESLLRQEGIADRLSDFPEVDRLLRETYVAEKMLRRFDGVENLKTTFKVTPPLLPLCEAAGQLGFAQVWPDQDGKVRKYPLLLYYDGRVYPALGLTMACEYMGVDMHDIRIVLGKYIDLPDADGKILRRIPINEKGEMYINWAGRWRDTFEKVSFARVVETDPNTGRPTDAAVRTAQRFKDKIVLLGLTATGTHDLNPVPDQPRYPMVGAHANVISEILLGEFVTLAPVWVNVLAIAGAVLTVGLVSGLTSNKLNVPLSALAILAYTGASFWAFVSWGVWMDMSCAYLGMILCYACMLFYRYVTEEKQKKLVKHIFQHYMTSVMVNELINNPDIKLGGEKRTATVLFSDVAGFTTISEGMPPEELVPYLNEYLTTMTDIILDEEAYLDKYEGDAIMAVFGVPVDHGDHAVRACRAALGNRAALPKMWESWEARGLPKLNMRIGLNTGAMIVGNMGSQRRLDYTVIGDPVNLASRLEAANKVFSTAIMIGPETQEKAAPHFDTRCLGLLQVKGKAESAKVYELLGEKDSIDSAKKEVVDIFHEGLDLFYNREWTKALDLFLKASTIIKEDGPSEHYVRECEKLLASPPLEEWDGVVRLETK